MWAHCSLDASQLVKHSAELAYHEADTLKHKRNLELGRYRQMKTNAACKRRRTYAVVELLQQRDLNVAAQRDRIDWLTKRLQTKHESH